MIAGDREEFDRLVASFGVLYRREVGAELAGEYWHELRDFNVGVVVVAAAELKRQLSRFPTIADWRRACFSESARRAETRRAQRPRPTSDVADMSRWGIVGNRLLLRLAYFDRRRGFAPIATYPPPPVEDWRRQPLDRALLDRVLATKAVIVADAEHAEAAGNAWTLEEFVDVMCTAFEKLLLPERSERAA